MLTKLFTLIMQSPLKKITLVDKFLFLSDYLEAPKNLQFVNFTDTTAQVTQLFFLTLDKTLYSTHRV